MGVRGLKTFLKENDIYPIRNLHLHNCPIVIDASNLMNNLMDSSQSPDCADLYGSDFVGFAKCLNLFFNNLDRCNIKPVLVFDGAQSDIKSFDKTRKRIRRFHQRFNAVMRMNLYKTAPSKTILSPLSSSVMKSVACSRNIKVIQATYEADSDIARVAHVYNGPVLTDDSDFYLYDLPEGVISFDSFNYRELRKSSSGHSYILCDMFKQSEFVKFFPGLEPECLPLFGVISGNDFVDPSHHIDRYILQDACQFKYNERSFRSKEFERKFRILYFLTNRGLEENITAICQKLPTDERISFKYFLKDCLKVYEIPEGDILMRELIKLTRDGYYSMHTKENIETVEYELRNKVKSLSRWLRNIMERSVLPSEVLKLMFRNVIFVRPFMDDINLPSSHLCLRKCYEVILQLTRVSTNDRRTCILHDRGDGCDNSEFFLYPKRILDGFGPLNFTILDVPTLSQYTRLRILFATFNSSPKEYSDNLSRYLNWFDQENAREFLIIKIIFKYIDGISLTKLEEVFKKSTLICYLYYLADTNRDKTFSLRLKDSRISSILDYLREIVESRKLNRAFRIGYNHKSYNYNSGIYDSRIMHQISQLQTSFFSFNMLNAFLGCPSSLLKCEHWLNSCFIYNFTQFDKELNVRLGTLETIINSK